MPTFIVYIAHWLKMKGNKKMIKAIAYLLGLSVCLPLSVEANVTTEKQRLLDELQSSIQYMQGIATRGTREPIVFEALKPHQAFDPKQAEHFIALPAQTEHTVPTLQTFLRKCRATALSSALSFL